MHRRADQYCRCHDIFFGQRISGYKKLAAQSASAGLSVEEGPANLSGSRGVRALNGIGCWADSDDVADLGLFSRSHIQTVLSKLHSQNTIFFARSI